MKAASPYRLPTRDLGRRPGSMQTVELDVAVTDPMGNEVIAVPAGAEISLDLRLEAVMDGVLVSGTATATARGECVRCLDAISRDLTIDFTELFAYSGSQQEEVQEEGEELLELDGDVADLEATVTDAVVLALPFQPLCRPDCPGLCSVCGIRLADAEPGHAHEQIDPRWAALSALRDGEADDPDESGERGGGPGEAGERG